MHAADAIDHGPWSAACLFLSVIAASPDCSSATPEEQQPQQTASSEALRRIIMEHLSTLVGRTLATVAPPSEEGGEVLSVRRTRTLFDLVDRFEQEEEQHNADAVVPVSKLRATPEGLIDIPGIGACALTDWSRKQMASLLGVRLDRWFENASPVERADEMNRRLRRATGDIRVRSTRIVDADADADGTVKAFVSVGYSAIADSAVARIVMSALRPMDTDMRLLRTDVTDRSSTFSVAVGKPFNPCESAIVGQVWGSVTIRLRRSRETTHLCSRRPDRHDGVMRSRIGGCDPRARGWPCRSHRRSTSAARAAVGSGRTRE